MPFPVARMRRIIAYGTIFLSSFAYSLEDTLFTSSVTYCAPPETLIVQQFDFAYIAKNTSIFFNISAASVESNVTVEANLLLNVYGMKPINKSINLCNLLSGALCPLPLYNFTGTDYLTLPPSLAVSSRIPDIAFKIPDLEAYAQLSLIEVGTGSIKACVQATLSNGWSTRQTAVEWSTKAMALLALLLAIPQSFVPDAVAPFRLLDLLFLYQSIAASALLNLNYPSVYRSFALNFAWSMGLVFTSVSSPVQNSINHMRHITGGNMPDAEGSAIGLVNRKLSPYSAIHVNPKTVNAGLNTTSDIIQPRVREVATVTQTSSNVLQAGVPIYVNSVNIGTANAFMTVFITVLILAAIVLAVFGLGYIAILVMHRYRWATEERRIELKRAYPDFVKAWSLRLCLIAFAPVTIFAIYQWTLKDSRLSLALSVIALASILCGILYPTFLTLRLVFRSKPYDLYTTPHYLATLGPLYAQYRPSRFYFFLPLLFATLLKATLITFLNTQGEAQAIAIAVIEVLLLVGHATLRPHTTRRGDLLGIVLASARLIAAGLAIGFVQRLRLAAIPRVVIGIVIGIVLSVAVLCVWVNVLMHAVVVVRVWVKQGRVRAGRRRQEESMVEKRGALVHGEYSRGSERGSFRSGSPESMRTGSVYEVDTRWEVPVIHSEGANGDERWV